MKYRSLGRCGLKVSEISLGGWTTFGESIKDRELSRRIILTAYEHGVNFFDIADVYGLGEAERMMGEVLRQLPRHRLVISSKVFWPMSDDINDRGLSRKHIMESIDRSLKRVGTDYLDLYFCHRYDEHTPLEETCRAMDDLIHQGKVLYWGTSEWTGAQIQNALDVCEGYNLYKPQVEQPQYNMLYRQRIEQEIIPLAEQWGIGLVIWSPLASGVLSGKYDNGIPEDSRLGRMEWLHERFKGNEGEAFRRAKALRPIAEGLGITRAQLAIAWTLRKGAVSSAITGATKIEQLQENLKVVELRISDDSWGQVDAIMA